MREHHRVFSALQNVSIFCVGAVSFCLLPEWRQLKAPFGVFTGVSGSPAGRNVVDAWGNDSSGSMPRNERPKGALLLSAWGNAPGTGSHHDLSPEGATQARQADAYMESTVHGMVRPYRAACGVGF